MVPIGETKRIRNWSHDPRLPVVLPRYAFSPRLRRWCPGVPRLPSPPSGGTVRCRCWMRWSVPDLVIFFCSLSRWFRIIINYYSSGFRYLSLRIWQCVQCDFFARMRMRLVWVCHGEADGCIVGLCLSFGKVNQVSLTRC